MKTRYVRDESRGLHLEIVPLAGDKLLPLIVTARGVTAPTPAKVYRDDVDVWIAL